MALPSRLTGGALTGSVMAVGGLMLAVKLIAILKDAVIASRFGTSDDLDVFFLAIVFQGLLVNVIAGAANLALVPVYVETRERDGTEAARQLLAAFQGWTAALLGGTVLVIGLFSPVLVAGLGAGFAPEKRELAVRVFLLLLPWTFLNGVGLLWAGILNAQKRFALAAFAPAITPIAVGLVVLFWGGQPGRVYGLSTATLAGAMLELALLAWGLRRLGLPICPRRPVVTPALRKIGQQYAPMAVGALLISTSPVVDQFMAGLLGPGSVSALNYGNKLVGPLLAVGANALGAVLFPHFARMAAQNAHGEMGWTLRASVQRIILLSVPLTLLLMALSPWLVGLLFQRGAFTPEDTALVSRVQMFTACQIPFYLAAVPVVRLISALQANYLLMRAAAAGLTANVLLDWLLMRWLGVAGIALSTTGVYLVTLAICLWGLRALLREREALSAQG